MAVNNLNFQGINRAISDYGSAGACEELINLRPTTSGLVPVKPFTTKRTVSAASKIFIHNLPSGRHILQVYAAAPHIVVTLLDDRGSGYDTTFTLIRYYTTYTHFSLDQVHFAYAGNIILFSIVDEADNFFLNKAYIWKLDSNGVMSYVEIDGTIPSVSASLSTSTPVLKTSDHITVSSDDPEMTLREGFNNMVNSIEADNPDVCFGHVIVALAFKTNDGQTIWTGNWLAFNPFAYINNNTFVPEGVIWWFTSGTKHYYNLWYGNENGDYCQFAGVPLSVSLTLNDNWSEESSIVSSVEIYASRPVRYADIYSAENLISGEDGEFRARPVSIDSMDLGGQILYHQASVPLRELSSASKTVSLTFGGNTQVTEETLEVDSGLVSRYGKLLAYNARFHFYDSVSKTTIDMPNIVNGTTSGSSATARVVVDYEDLETRKTMYLGTKTIYPSTPPKIVIAPSLNIKRVYLCYQQSSLWYTLTYEMTRSSTYNFSIFASDTAPSASNGLPTGFSTLISGTANGTLITKEEAAINVTEQYSPFVFLVDHSYLAPGKVLDLRPQLYSDADSSFGLYPLNVFTTRGLYALNQGSANVLYGDFDALSNLVCTSVGNSIPTESGTFFLAQGGLWLIMGRRTVLISDALSGGPHKEIRSCTGFTALVSDAMYGVTNYLSNPTFDDYVNGVNGTNVLTPARLSYNRHRDEIYISNSSYSYSYALSLKYRQWFKISTAIWQDSFSGSIALTIPTGSGSINILDLEAEVDQSILVHLQSRPFSIGYSYSHIHRVVAMVKCALATTDKLILSLYGSDNLMDWTLLSYAARTSTSTATPAAKLLISQIRTATAARSWRYYTICIGGTVPTLGHADAGTGTTKPTYTDFGPVIYEYEPVIRRIG